jgi:hypothetical protein
VTNIGNDDLEVLGSSIYFFSEETPWSSSSEVPTGIGPTDYALDQSFVGAHSGEIEVTFERAALDQGDSFEFDVTGQPLMIFGISGPAKLLKLDDAGSPMPDRGVTIGRTGLSFHDVATEGDYQISNVGAAPAEFFILRMTIEDSTAEST